MCSAGWWEAMSSSCLLQTQEDYSHHRYWAKSWWMDWWVSCWFHASCFFFPLCYITSIQSLHLSLSTLCCNKINGIIHASVLLRFTQCGGEIRVQTHFPCQKHALFLCVKQRLQCSEWWIMDQFDEDVCQHNTLSDGVSSRMETCKRCNIMFWISTSCSAPVYAPSNILSSKRSSEMMQTNE